MPVNDDLDLLEGWIRQLQIEWDKFFGGTERKPPHDLRGRVEQLIRRYAYAEIRNNTDRFRYQTLVARYNTFNELWNKRVRAMEEGRPLGLHGRAVAPPPPAPAPAAPAPRAAAAASSSVVPEYRVKSADGENVRDLYDRFLQMRQAAGEQPVKFESFQKLIRDQSARIMADRGAQAVDFRLEVKDGKVSLKAKPVKG
jgi:hypothetical protein